MKGGAGTAASVAGAGGPTGVIETALGSGMEASAGDDRSSTGAGAGGGGTGALIGDCGTLMEGAGPMGAAGAGAGVGCAGKGFTAGAAVIGVGGA